MKRLCWIATALLLVAQTAGATSQATEQHQQHHPNTAPANAVPTPSAQAANANMAQKLDAMRDMHARMLAAKTPSERQALMKAHMKAMQEGMAAMSDSSMPAGMKCEMGAREASMEARMQMMEMMMQMMMDRMPAEPGNEEDKK